MFKRQRGIATAETASQPHPGVPYPPQLVLELITRHKGNVSKVADSMGAARHAMSVAIHGNPVLKQALIDARERFIDNIELSVLQRAHEGTDTQLQKFVLQTQAKHRGWGDDSNKEIASTLAREAFDFVVNRSKNPAERKPLTPPSE